ncbi:DUF2807 domain-containing protein [Flaviaesturariibacter flavus]|uniref:DUF2807 domain-containing protein n=1 Tax=Flaviaesturariibacter flavus TaxID=2502780 RepID=A0A4R1BIC9_9BACT|nr:head GIN domain-containing protein [Flaviaesturariibacter flavus]TCJ17023.1 DUF2807 domain-containing protein [Flaviaesturariibacter flavus]
MKKLLLAAGLLVTAGAVSAQNESPTGNGNVVTREVPVSSFDEIRSGGIYQLQLSQGTKESVTIEADENLQQYFSVKNNGSKLVIEMTRKDNFSIRKSTRMVVHVTFRNLKSMDLQMVGNVRSAAPLTFSDLRIRNSSVGAVDLKLTANTLKLDNSAVGAVSLSGKADRAVINSNAVGAIHAGDFVVQTLTIDNDGVGSAEVNAEKEINVKDSFLGKVKNLGAAKMKKKETI